MASSKKPPPLKLPAPKRASVRPRAGASARPPAGAPLLTPGQVAARLGVSTDAVLDLMRYADMPCHPRFVWGEIEAWLPLFGTEREVQATLLRYDKAARQRKARA